MFFFACARDDAGLNRAERRAGEHCRRPCAEVLGRKVLAADLLQVCVDIGRRHVTASPLVVQTTGRAPARQVTACTNDAARACGPSRPTFVALAALASKLKSDRRPFDIEVSIAQRGQTKAAICRAYSSLPTRMRVTLEAAARRSPGPWRGRARTFRERPQSWRESPAARRRRPCSPVELRLVADSRHRG